MVDVAIPRNRHTDGEPMACTEIDLNSIRYWIPQARGSIPPLGLG
jgi:hypothetical protein